ncbi:7tm chemosensory receptor domain-containing protein [Phthorimaea operculella]|nr:7tm chemosensory receptor domain-containing protein [Phthorimaea operculella]
MCIDKILDINHHDEIQTKLVRLTSLLLFCLITVSAFDYMAWYLGYGFWTPIYYSISYFFLLFKVLTNLDLTVQIMQIECRLRDIGDLLQDTYNSTDYLPIPESMKENNQTLSNSLTNKNWFYGGGYLRAEEMKTRNHPWKKATNSCHEMKWLTRCYLLINEQCMFINRMFGIRILLNSLSLLIDMVRFLNVVVRIAVGSVKTQYNDNSGYLPALSTFLRFLICVFILASLVYHCERAYAQTYRIVSVTDHILVNRNPDEALRSSLSELRCLVTSRPISFNMANFFQLSYPFLTSMISVVVTYTIILLQSL